MSAQLLSRLSKSFISKSVLAGVSLAMLGSVSSAQQLPGTSGGNGSQTLGTISAQNTNATQNQDAEWQMHGTSEVVRVPLDKVVSVRLPAQIQNVVVANPLVADIILPQDGTGAHAYILARQVGSTSIIFEDIDGNILFQGDIQVDVDVAGIQSALKELLPDELIEVSSQRNGVFLKGFVRDASTSAHAVNIARRFVPDSLNIINNMEVLGSRQVILQVRVAEMKRTAIKKLGLDLTATLEFGPLSSISFTPAYAATAVDSAFATGTVVPGITGLGDISYRVMEQTGLAKTLAEPTLTAISGETATFLAGGSFPMPTAVDDNGTVTYEQQEYGVRLSFTPTVMGEGQISLHLATEVSDQDTTVAVNGFPGLSMKRTETIIDLPSGGSMMISGLIQNDVSNTINGVPGFKELPILGQLFRSENFQNEETELIVTVTAYLAKSVGNDSRLALPTDGFVPASDLDMYLLGHLHKQYTHTNLPPYAAPLAGTFGYIME
ncbi:type II and III secretion system protein family protein [Magnetovibrio sp. PR-2]|uniref:type II and III secretion system protein family protein n=1 Tax=Magnetovibrio sp. PR-2 TaxID=3120356 RepID=UPI002FCDE4B8